MKRNSRWDLPIVCWALDARGVGAERPPWALQRPCTQQHHQGLRLRVTWCAVRDSLSLSTLAMPHAISAADVPALVPGHKPGGSRECSQARVAGCLFVTRSLPRDPLLTLSTDLPTPHAPSCFISCPLSLFCALDVPQLRAWFSPMLPGHPEVSGSLWNMMVGCSVWGQKGF